MRGRIITGVDEAIEKIGWYALRWKIEDGLITNDKFCLSRFRQLKLSWWRLPLRLRETCPSGCPSSPNLSAAGGNDAGVADAPDMPASSGRAAPVGSDLSAIDGMDKAVTRRRGPDRRRTSRTGGEP